MQSYFSSFLQIEFAAAEKSCRDEIEQDQAKAASEGKLLSGRTWRVLEKILVHSLSKYGETIVQKLQAIEPDHSPVRVNDFEAAKASIRAYKKLCEALHTEQRIKPALRYPQSYIPFQDGALDRAEAKAINDVDGVLIVFNSKRSFVKWAVGDFQKQLWSGSLIVFGSIIGGILIPAIKSTLGL